MSTKAKVALAEARGISRQDLYQQVWTTPIFHLAAKWGVTGTYLARVCDALNVPRPPLGYWQRKAVGKADPAPLLPLALPGDQLSWTTGAVLSPPPKSAARRRYRADKAKAKIPSRHPVLFGVEAEFRRSRKVEEGEFLKPYKQLLPDIVTSEARLVRSLDIANEVYSALDRNGHRVLMAPPNEKMRRVHIDEREFPQKDRKYGRYWSGSIWTPFRPTITYIGAVPFGIAITEMTERVSLRHLGGQYVREDSKAVKTAKPWQLANSWASEQDLPSGRFRLIAYSPMNGVDWTKAWQETPTSPISAVVPDFVRKLESSTQEVQALMKAAAEEAARRKREWEEAQERHRRDEDRRCVVQARAESQKQLAEIIQEWATAMSVERFFKEAERRMASVESDYRAELQERLTLARAMLGTLDPLEYLEEWLAPEERYKSKYPWPW